jgi:regulator of protease activity HflC (stomatin/prohibitin superfamily)
LAEVIKSKTEAIQKAQQAELDKITAQAEAETKIAQAKGDSAQAVITAAGEAEAIKLKTRELSPTYVEYIRWVNANGDVPRVPSTVLGSNTPLIYNKQ